MSWSKDKWYTYKNGGSMSHAVDNPSPANKALINTLFGKAFRVVDKDNNGNVLKLETMKGLDVLPEHFSASWTALLSQYENQFFEEVNPDEYAIDHQPTGSTASNDANELLRVMFIFKKRGSVVPSSDNFIDLDSYLTAIRVMLSAEAKKAKTKIEEAKADLVILNEVLK